MICATLLATALTAAPCDLPSTLSVPDCIASVRGDFNGDGKWDYAALGANNKALRFIGAVATSTDWNISELPHICASSSGCGLEGVHKHPLTYRPKDAQHVSPPPWSAKEVANNDSVCLHFQTLTACYVYNGSWRAVFGEAVAECNAELPSGVKAALSESDPQVALLTIDESFAPHDRCPVVLQGDFNGDGHQDFAVILQGQKEAFVRVAFADADKWQLSPRLPSACSQANNCQLIPGAKRPVVYWHYRGADEYSPQNYPPPWSKEAKSKFQSFCVADMESNQSCYAYDGKRWRVVLTNRPE